MQTEIVKASGNMVLRDDQGREIEQRGETMAVTAAAQAEATVKARYAIALRMRRDQTLARKAILDDCTRPRFAAEAVYEKPIGRKKDDGDEEKIQGLSIRFAEAALRYWNNVCVETAVVYEDTSKVQIRTTVMDLEANITYADDAILSKTVERRYLRKGQVPLGERTNSGGAKVFIVPCTDDELTMKMNAAKSKCIRNAVLRLLPADLKDEAMETALDTSEREEREKLPEMRAKMISAFSGIGADEEALASYLGHSPKDATVKEVGSLRRLFGAIKEGETTWGAALESVLADRRPALLAEAAKSEAALVEVKKAEATSAPAPAESAETKPVVEQAAAVMQELTAKSVPPVDKPTPPAPAPKTPEFAKWLVERFREAKTAKQLAKLSVRASDCPEEMRKDVLAIFEECRAELA